MPFSCSSISAELGGKFILKNNIKSVDINKTEVNSEQSVKKMEILNTEFHFPGLISASQWPLERILGKCITTRSIPRTGVVRVTYW